MEITQESIHRRKNKPSYIDTMNYYSAKKKKELTTDHATTWINLKNILNTRSQKCMGMIPFI